MWQEPRSCYYVYGLPLATIVIQDLTTVSSKSMCTSKFNLRPSLKEYREITSPSDDTHLKPITVWGNLVCIRREMSFGLYTSHLLFCVLCFWSWQQYFLIGKERNYLWFSRLFDFVQKFHRLCQTIFASLFYEKLISMTLVWIVTKVFIECKASW